MSKDDFSKAVLAAWAATLARACAHSDGPLAPGKPLDKGVDGCMASVLCNLQDRCQDQATRPGIGDLLDARNLLCADPASCGTYNA